MIDRNASDTLALTAEAVLVHAGSERHRNDDVSILPWREVAAASLDPE